MKWIIIFLLTHIKAFINLHHFKDIQQHPFVVLGDFADITEKVVRDGDFKLCLKHNKFKKKTLLELGCSPTWSYP